MDRLGVRSLRRYHIVSLHNSRMRPQTDADAKVVEPKEGAQNLIGRLVRKIIRAFFVAWTLVNVACSVVVAESKSPVKFGALLALTGDVAMQNRAFRDGIELAVAKINSGGGLSGRPIVVIFEDTRLNPKEANSAGKKLISVDHVDAAINATVIEVKGAGYDFVKAKIPSVTLWDASEDIQRIGNYVFSIGLWTPSSGETASKFASQALGARSAVILNTQDEWSAGASEHFTSLFQSKGGQILRTFTFNPDEKDFRAALAIVKTLKPEVIYAPVTLNFVPLFKQFRALKFDIPIITSDIITHAHISSEPDIFEGTYQTQVAVSDSAAAKQMAADYQKHFGRECDQIQYVAWGYDAVNLLARALVIGGNNSEKVRDALASTKDFVGASGITTFNERGAAPKVAKMFQIRNNKIIACPSSS